MTIHAQFHNLLYLYPCSFIVALSFCRSFYLWLSVQYLVPDSLAFRSYLILWYSIYDDVSCICKSRTTFLKLPVSKLKS